MTSTSTMMGVAIAVVAGGAIGGNATAGPVTYTAEFSGHTWSVGEGYYAGVMGVSGASQYDAVTFDDIASRVTGGNIAAAYNGVAGGVTYGSGDADIMNGVDDFVSMTMTGTSGSAPYAWIVLVREDTVFTNPGGSSVTVFADGAMGFIDASSYGVTLPTIPAPSGFAAMGVAATAIGMRRRRRGG